MKLKKYPKYKESGVQWIGEVPEGWEVKRSSFYVKPIMGFPFDSENFSSEGFPLIRIRDLLNQKIETYYDGDYPKSYTIRKGEHLIGMDGDFHNVIWESKDALLNQRVMKIKNFKPHILNKKYYYYCIGEALKVINDLTYSTTVKHLSDDDIRKCEVPIPKKEEQIACADFLDSKTSQISKTIEADKRLIELLKEKRTALINHVVTKGINPKAKMKDSGIEWIGEVPEGWETKRLRFNALVNPSDKKALSNPKSKVSFLPMDKVSVDGDYDKESEAEYQDVSIGYTYFKDNDVLVAKITPCFENGKGTLVNNLKNSFGFGTTEFHVIRVYDNLDSKYLFYLTKTHLFRVNGEAFMEGSAGQKRVSTEFIKDFIMVTPLKPEQHQIVQYLDKATSKIDQTIQKIEEKIELLEEYKKSLIHHVVTGKVDVREAVA